MGLRRRRTNDSAASWLAKDENGSSNDGTVMVPSSFTAGAGAIAGAPGASAATALPEIMQMASTVDARQPFLTKVI